MARKLITVIGGANTDICGAPLSRLERRESNPGRISIGFGGVGRNIAHDLVLLDTEVRFITALGEDVFGRAVMDGCLALGMDMSMTRTLRSERSSVYMYVTDERGDMDVAVADMDIVEKLDPEYLALCMERVNDSDAVVIDGNLSAAAIEFIAGRCTAPLYADPVSCAKAPRMRAVLGRLAAIKPNLAEARTLTGADSAEDCADALIAAGAGRVLISLGARGLLAAEGDERILLPCAGGEIVNTNGAGDAVTAALVWAGVNGLGLESAARAAQRSGAISAASAETNSPLLSAEALI